MSAACSAEKWNVVSPLVFFPVLVFVLDEVTAVKLLSGVTCSHPKLSSVFAACERFGEDWFT